MTRLVIAVVLISVACRVRVPVAPVLAPGLTVPLPAVLLALIAAANVALVAVVVRRFRRGGWLSRSYR